MAFSSGMTSVKNISLYIPRMAEDSHKNSQFKDLNDFIRFRFKALAIGEVSHVDFKKGFVNKDGRMYYKAFVHFNLWYDNPTTRSIQDRIFHEAEYNSCAKLVYDDPHYWMLLEYKENQNKSKKQQAFELVSKLEQQLAQVAEMAEMFKLAQARINTGQYESAPPGSKRSRMATYSY